MRQVAERRPGPGGQGMAEAVDNGRQRRDVRGTPGEQLGGPIAQRCGYELEGTLRAAYFKQGRREDTEIWSRLAPGVGDGDFAG